MKHWAFQELWVYWFAGPPCHCSWYNHCCLEHVLQDVRNHVMWLSESDVCSESNETECGFLLLTPVVGRRVGFLVEVAFRPTGFSLGGGLLS